MVELPSEMTKGRLVRTVECEGDVDPGFLRAEMKMEGTAAIIISLRPLGGIHTTSTIVTIALLGTFDSNATGSMR